MFNEVEPTLLDRPIEVETELARRRLFGGGGRQAAVDAARARSGRHELTSDDARKVEPAELARRAREQAVTEEAQRRAGELNQQDFLRRRSVARRRRRPVDMYVPGERDGVHPNIENEGNSRS